MVSLRAENVTCKIVKYMQVRGNYKVVRYLQVRGNSVVLVLSPTKKSTCAVVTCMQVRGSSAILVS